MACEVTRYDCAKDAEIIARIGHNANVQLARNDGFKNIFPWKKQCSEESVHFHYVARNSAGLICGWMTVLWKTEFGQKYVYINEITTRRIKDEFYGGVGQRLHTRLVEDANAGGAEFIYLYPLNPVVAEIYKKWGYVHARPEIVNMFLMLKGAPNRAMLDSLMPPDPRIIMVAVHEFAMRRPQDNALLELIEKTRRNMLSNPAKMRELKETLEIIEGTEYLEEDDDMPEEGRLSLADKRAMISEVLRSVKGGKRKIRASRKANKKRRTITQTRKNSL